MRPIANLAIVLLIATATQAQAAPAFVAEVPFHDCRGMICLDVQIEGTGTRTFLLDTGNEGSVVTTTAAKVLGWALEDVKQNGKVVAGVQRAGAHDIGFGKTRIGGKFLAYDPSVFGDSPPPGDGTLAYTFFKDRIVQIDYPKHLVRISDVIDTPAVTHASAKPDAPGTLQLITFGKKGPPIVVGAPFTVNGKSVHAQIDTCYSGTLLVYDAALAKLGLKKHGTAEFFADTDGGVNMLAAPAQSLGFAQQTLLGSQPTMYFVGEGKNPVHQPDGLFEATVGNALFVHSVVTFDFHAMTLDVRNGD